jgi:hypothetical protein
MSPALAVVTAALAAKTNYLKTNYPTKYPTKFPTSFKPLPGQCPPQGKACSARGDPHYHSFDGLRFDWQGQCEYVMVRDARKEGSTQFEVQVRHTDRRLNKRASRQVSMALAVAIRLPNGDLVELQRDQTCRNNFPPLFPDFTPGNTINGKPMQSLPFVDKDGNRFEYGPVPKQLTRKRRGYKGRTIMITIPSVGAHVIWTGCNWVETRLDAGSPLCGNTAGLCGNADNDKHNDYNHKGMYNNWQAGHNYPDAHGFNHANGGIPHIFSNPKTAGGQCANERALPPATPDDGCEAHSKDWIAADAVCNVLTAPEGQYAACHKTIPPHSHYQECMLDACMIDPSEAASTISDYEEDCCERNIHVGDGCVPWAPKPPIGGWPQLPDPLTPSPTTASPTTASPTTASPTTASPTTASPTSASPTTASPTTASPTTASPTTAAPIDIPMTSVSGDPFVVDQRGTKVQFFLPLQKEAMLLSCTGMELYGRTMGSGIDGDHQQWFDQIRIVADAVTGSTVSDGRDTVLVRINENATQTAEQSDTDVSREHQVLSTLHVIAEGAKVKRTGALILESAMLATWVDAKAETVQYSAGSMVLQIKSAVANKFSGEEQVRLTHLDMRFVELKSKECTGGILAQIWGFIPMTEQTVALMKPQE